jgi:hypothetical protein
LLCGIVPAGTMMNAWRQLRTNVAVGEPTQAVLAGREALEQSRVGQASELNRAQRRPAASFCGVANRDAAGRAHNNNGTYVYFAYATSGCSVDRQVPATSGRRQETPSDVKNKHRYWTRVKSWRHESYTSCHLVK